MGLRHLSLIALTALMLLGSACAQRGDGIGDGPIDTATLRYVGKSKQECATIRFVCEPGERYFANDVGCGCESGEDPEKPDPAGEAPAEGASSGGDAAAGDAAGDPRGLCRRSRRRVWR